MSDAPKEFAEVFAWWRAALESAQRERDQLEFEKEQLISEWAKGAARRAVACTAWFGFSPD